MSIKDELRNGSAKRYDDTTFGTLMKFWPIMAILLTSLVTGAVAYGVIRAEVDRNKKTLDERTLVLNNHERRITKVETIAETMPVIQSDIKNILKEIRRQD